MNNENQMTEAESVQLIASMINRAKNRFSENGFLYLLWGWVILGCCIFQYLAMYVFHYADGAIIWLVCWLLLIFQIFYLRRKTKSTSVKTYTEGLSGFVWLAFMISLFIVLFTCIEFDQPLLLYPILLVLYGIATFMSGAILQFRPLIFGGMLCWALAVVSPFVAPLYHLLLLSVAVIGAWIVPGYLLKARYKKEN